MFLWLRFVDDTITAVKVDSIDYIPIDKIKHLPHQYPVYLWNGTKQTIFKKPNNTDRYLT